MEKDVKFLRVDVDGYVGLIKGVPNLLQLFDDLGIRASFFFVMGNEANLLDILRFRKNYSDSKMIKRRYGILGILRRILFPKCLGRCHADILRRTTKKHEVGIHGWNHLRWVHGFGRINKEEELRKAVKSFKDILGKKPAGFVPPGFVMSTEVYEICAELGIRYISSKVGKKIEKILLKSGSILEIPLSSRTTLEENEKQFRKELDEKYARVYIHADYEGLNTDKLRKILEGYEILPLSKAAEYLEEITVDKTRKV